MSGLGIGASRFRRGVPDAASAVPIGLRSGLILAVAVVGGLMMFCWPLLAHAKHTGLGQASDAPLLFVLVIPLVICVVLAAFGEGGMDAKALAMLGVLSAVDAGLRPLGAGIGGVELVFFLLVLGGRVFGPGFGFVLGCTSLFASALITAGVGPWLPFQMMSSAMIGLGAGLLPRLPRGRSEIAMLAVYGALAAYLFGALMNMWFWPYATGPATSVSFVPGGPLVDNLRRFAVYTLTTSTLGWDSVRAITNVVGVLVFGPAVLATLRRASRRASFGARPTYSADTGEDSPHVSAESQI